MIRKTIGAMAVAAALFATSAQAQTPAQDHAMREGPHAPLMHRQELGLSAEQAARLDAIHARMQAAHKEQCGRMANADAQQKEAMHARMREAMQAAHQEAASVLTAEQRARLDSLHAAHHGAGAQAQHGAGHAHHGAQASGGHAHGAGHAQHGAQAGGAHAQHGDGHAQHGAQGGGHAAKDCCGEAECCAAGTCSEGAHVAGRTATRGQQHGAHQHGSQGGHNH